MKLFMSVYVSDYQKMDDKKKFKKFNKIKLPDEAQFEWLKQFFKTELGFAEHSELLDIVQRNRNAVHSFQAKVIENQKVYAECLERYVAFLKDIDNRLPYPDEIYRH